MTIRSDEEEEAVRLLRAQHQALAGLDRDAHRTLVEPGLLSNRDLGVRAQFRRLFEYDPSTADPLPVLPPDVGEDDMFRHPIGTIFVKQRQGPEVEVDTLPWVMQHLKPLKAAGPFGDRYEHYKIMPQSFVHWLVQTALNGQLSDGARFIWQSGLLHAGDKQRRTPEGYHAARPIVVGTAIRRITGRVPCVQLKHDFAREFAKVRALGSAIPAGIEIAFRTITLAIDDALEHADDYDPQHLPVPLQTDFKDGFTNAKRRLMLTTARSLFPSLLRYLYTCYDSVGKLWMLDSGQLVEAFDCGEGIWQGDPLGNSCFSMAIYTFMELLKAKLRPEASQGRQVNGSAVSWIVDDCTMVPRRFKVVELVKFIINNGPAHGLYPNMDKFFAWIVRSDKDAGELHAQLSQLGVQVSEHGLDRLLGAPVGTQQFMVRPGGQLSRIAAKAARYIELIKKVGHSQAQYHLL